MRLSLEEIRKSYKRAIDTHYKDGYITIFIDVFNCYIDTIEEQQKEIDRLNKEIELLKVSYIDKI